MRFILIAGCAHVSLLLSCLALRPLSFPRVVLVLGSRLKLLIGSSVMCGSPLVGCRVCVLLSFLTSWIQLVVCFLMWIPRCCLQPAVRCLCRQLLLALLLLGCSSQFWGLYNRLRELFVGGRVGLASFFPVFVGDDLSSVRAVGRLIAGARAVRPVSLVICGEVLSFAQRVITQRCSATVQISKVTDHATDFMVEHDQISSAAKLGNDLAGWCCC